MRSNFIGWTMLFWVVLITLYVLVIYNVSSQAAGVVFILGLFGSFMAASSVADELNNLKKVFIMNSIGFIFVSLTVAVFSLGVPVAIDTQQNHERMITSYQKNYQIAKKAQPEVIYRDDLIENAQVYSAKVDAISCDNNFKVICFVSVAKFNMEFRYNYQQLAKSLQELEKLTEEYVSIAESNGYKPERLDRFATYSKLASYDTSFSNIAIILGLLGVFSYLMMYRYSKSLDESAGVWSADITSTAD